MPRRAPIAEQRSLGLTEWTGGEYHTDNFIMHMHACLSVDIAAFEVKYYSQWNEREAFRQLPKSMSLAAGIVDEGSYHVEPVKKLRERIAGWAALVGEERLWISSSCGFGRHTARDIPILRAKMENMVEAARTL